MPQAQSARTIFTKPPVIERIVGIYRQMPVDTFESRVGAWIEKMHSEYPVAASFPEWDIKIEEQTEHRIPVVKNITPRARLVHRRWKSDLNGRHVFGFDVRSDRLVFRVLREKNAVHDFSEIEAELQRWAPAWMEHFGIRDLDGTTLEYVNELSPVVTPQFVSKDGKSLEISEALALFVDIPGKHKRLAPPYDCQVCLVFDETIPRSCHLRVFGITNREAAVQVLLNVFTRPHESVKQKSISLQQALTELRESHDVALEQFQVIFTLEALKSFQ